MRIDSIVKINYTHVKCLLEISKKLSLNKTVVRNFSRNERQKNMLTYSKILSNVIETRSNRHDEIGFR